MSCGVGRRHGLDLALLWLWHRPAALIRPLAWEPPHAAGAALKSQKEKKKEKKRKEKKQLLKIIDLVLDYLFHVPSM